MTRVLEVALAAGGTAGHINPALALAEAKTNTAVRRIDLRKAGSDRRVRAKAMSCFSPWLRLPPRSLISVW